MKERSLGLNGLLNGIRSVLNLLFPLITFPYVARVLSVDGLGKYNFANTYVGYFVLLAGLGISTYAVREGTKYRNNRLKISGFLSEIFSINLISTIIAYIMLIISLLIFKSLYPYAICILIFSTQIAFTTIGTEWIFIIYEDYSYITIRSILVKVLSIILLFIFVKNTNDYLIYAGITVLANAGSNIFNFFYVKKFCDIKLTLDINWKYHIKPILIIFATTIAVNIYLSSDTTILGLMKSDYDVGIYSTTVKIYNLVATLLGSVVAVTVPRLSMLLGQNKIKKYRNVFTEVINLLTVFVIPGTVGLIMLSQDIILLIAGKKYLPSVGSLKIIGLAIIFSNFSFIFINCALIPAKRETAALRNTLIPALINIILNLVLIPAFSYNGTAFSTVIAEFMAMLLNYWSARDLIRKSIISRSVMYNLISILIGSLSIIVICIFCNVLITGIPIKIIVSVILSSIFYFAVLIILKNDLAIHYWQIFRRKLKK
ncbi:flippase [Lactobacillus helveticus]|uniref:flippase n=1 Tax=Lactobacillus helveticus TaxID=1587 RepID=UPI0001FF972E|nr:flippase [Lactobacillus helveticus]ADX70910.1 Virulence factor MVIN protein [Lactobacillus helveticus H10]NRN84035.1 putative O-antigen transporter [Lactobacillus helveticus]